MKNRLLGWISFFAALAVAAPAAAGEDSFGPSSGGIVVDHHIALNPSYEVSFEAWVRPTPSSGCQTIISKGTPDYLGIWFGVCDGALRFAVDGSFTGSTDVTLPIDVWSHVAVTYDGVDREFYVNGVERDSSSVSRNWLASSYDVHIGADGSDRVWGGYLAEVRMWNRPLIGAEIRRRLHAAISESHEGLVAAWRLQGSANEMLRRFDGNVV